MDEEQKKHVRNARARTWGQFRFSVIGQLLASPPPSGELEMAITELAEKKWVHPINGKCCQFSFATIERWYYMAKKDKSPVEMLQNKIREDRGRCRALTEAIKEIIKQQHNSHKCWSYKLHADNIASHMRQANMLPIPSYPTVRRFLQSIGYLKQKRCRNSNRDGYKKSQWKRAHIEIRSFENEYVSGLWHLDFHHCSREVVTSAGEIVRPLALGIIDDHSRLLCHIQWYLAETSENLVHGLIQALQKRGLPRSLMTDNGAAMKSYEFTQGLSRLSIVHETTLPYSPYQNGKQEVLWGQVEGRLMAMLENKKHLTLKELNDITLSWAEVEYNKALHSEIKSSPLKRFLNNRDVSRQCPPLKELKGAFRQEVSRMVRKSDATVSIEGIRYEIPYRYHHLPKITIRYAQWDLTLVHMIDVNTGKDICQISPVNKHKNADGSRKTFDLPLVKDVEKDIEQDSDQIPPLLTEILVKHAETGLPPAYEPKEF